MLCFSLHVTVFIMTRGICFDRNWLFTVMVMLWYFDEKMHVFYCNKLIRFWSRAFWKLTSVSASSLSIAMSILTCIFSTHALKHVHVYFNLYDMGIAWWRHQMETFFALLAICVENSPVPGEFTGPRWIPRTKASDAEFWCFLWPASE